MPRLLFSKTGDAVWISHLDLMRLFQRAFKRSDLPLVHTQGFNPRPSVSIALPLSVGVESVCELLDFDLECEGVPCETITARLNDNLVNGIRVLSCYDTGRKIKDLAFLRCALSLEYDAGTPDDAVNEISALFSRTELTVPKKGKNGMVDQDIIPLIKNLKIHHSGDKEVLIDAVVCCQNPSLNPMQLIAAIERYCSRVKPDFARCRRMEIFDTEETVFR